MRRRELLGRALAAAGIAAVEGWRGVAEVAAAEAVRRGGTLTWAYTTIPLRLDPVWTQARTDSTTLSNIVQGLVRANATATAVEPALAERWTVSGNGLTYTFYLREARFHNGKTVTADDVIASLERSRSLGVYKWTLAEVKTLAKLNDSTVAIVLASPVASLLARLAVASNAIFPKEEVAAAGQKEFTKPIGTGPFMVRDWVPNDHLTLEANPHYWEIAPDGKPFPYLEQVIIKQVPEDTTKVLQIQAGSLSGAEAIPFSQLAALKRDPRGQLLTFPQQQVYFLVVQTMHPPFDDVKVRQAMSLALDRKVFVDRATAGLALPANSFMPRSGLFWNSRASLPYDPAKAKQLIKESKYPNGRGGITLQLPSGSQLGRDNAVLAQQMWGDVGIQVQIQETDGAALSATWYKGAYDAISGYQWTNGMMDPDQLVQFFFVEPRMNTGYRPSDRAVQLVKAAAEELDPKRRAQMYYEIQNIYNADVGGTISLYYTPSVNYLGPSVKGFLRTPLGVPIYWKVSLSR
jgi:peptide/nickel transport system substrate-binding protein